MVTFFSNFINEHQIPFCEAMYKRTNGAFRFVATEPIAKERIKIGFVDRSECFSYVIKSYESSENYEKALLLGSESDVVIIGSAPDEFIKERLKQNKLTFRYYERFFKEGRIRILDPRVLISHYKQDFRYRNKNLYMLCASAYTASDCRFIFSYPNKTYKWGYFPEVSTYQDVDTLINQKKSNSILWAGRQIDWKHPEYAIHLAKQLKREKVSFTLNMIGDGNMRMYLEDIIVKENLKNEVHILGSMPPEKVRDYMAVSDIFLFTSDRNEGWGAVLNESMSAGCAVVANKEIGSVPYLIKNGQNGLVYNRKDKNSLYKCVTQLIDNKELREAIQKNAVKTINTVWNAEEAADRLLTLIDCINNGTETPFEFGPCSKD